MAPADPTARRLLALSPATLLPSLGTSIANVALPDLARDFAVPMAAVQWVVIAYLLAVTALIVTAGRLGDLFGRRRLLTAGTLVFALASLAGPFVGALGWLVVLRLLQGAGAAVMMALSVAMVGDLVPRERTGRAMGLMATVSAVGTAIGPSLGGVLVAGWGWRAVFAAMALAAVLALAAVRLLLPRDAETGRAARRVDLPGIALLTLALTAGALAATRGGALAPALGLGGAVLMGAFVWHEGRARAPLVDLSLLQGASLWPGLAQMAVMSMIVMTTLVVGPFALAEGLGLSAAATGLVMSVGPGVVALAGVPAGRLVDRRGAGMVAVLGQAVTAAGALAMLVLPSLAGVAGYALSLALITGGYALFQSANATAIMAAAPQDSRGAVSGLLALSRNLGLIGGASVMGTIFAAGMAGGGPMAGLRWAFGVATLAVVAGLLVGGWRGRQAAG